MGRFNTPDTSKGSSPGDPGSWNKYAYVGADPINYNDPGGLVRCSVVGTFTTYPNPDDALTPVTTATIQCVGNLGSAMVNYTTSFDGNFKQAAKNAEAEWADLDRIERLDFLGNAIAGASDRLFGRDCAGLFLSPDSVDDVDARRYLSERLSRLGYIEGNSGAASIRIFDGQSASGPNVPAETTDTFGTIRIFAGGAFFTGLDGNGKNFLAANAGGPFAGMSLAGFEQLVVIHEFMHWMGIVGPDGGDFSNQRYTLPNGDVVTGSIGISQEVRNKCFQ